MTNEKYYLIYKFEGELIIEEYNTKENAQDVLFDLLNISDITNIRVLLGKEVQFTTTQKIIDVNIQEKDHVRHYCEFCDIECNNLTHDPYLYEIDDDDDKYWMCENCIKQRKEWLEVSK